MDLRELQADYSAEYLTAQYELKQEDYPEFLDYNSFVDCGELFSIPIARLKQGEFYGFLTDADREGVKRGGWAVSFVCCRSGKGKSDKANKNDYFFLDSSQRFHRSSLSRLMVSTEGTCPLLS